MRRGYQNLILTTMFSCFIVCLLGSAKAQGRPDLVWMRGGGFVSTFFGNSVAYSANGKLLATSDRYTTKLWRLSDGMLIRTLVFGSNLNGLVAFTPDSKSVIGVFGTVLRVWNVPDGSLTREVAGLSGNAESVAVSPDGQTAAVGLDTGVIELRSLSSGALVGTLVGHTTPVISIAYAPD